MRRLFAILIILLFYTNSFAATKIISDYPALTPMASNDLFLVEDVDAVAYKSVSLVGLMAAPGPIGGTTPGTGVFTTLTVSTKMTNAGNITLDAINAAADSTITLQNSDGTYEANIIVEGDLTKGVIQWNVASTDTIDGEQIANDTIDDDSIDWSDCTLADFDYQTAWRMFYSDGSGDVTEVALGANGTFLESNGASSVPAFRALETGDIPDISGTYQPLDADLTALAALSGTGLVTRTAAATYIERTITGDANEITVTNGDGVSGNPSLSIDLNRDLVTMAPINGGMNDAFVGADGDITISITMLGDLATTSPITGAVADIFPGATGNKATIGINNAAADSSTKGAASFTAADFDASSGLISLDYTNAQKADTDNIGFLTDTDWDTFNSKQSALTTNAMAATAPLSLSGAVIVIAAAARTISVAANSSSSAGVVSSGSGQNAKVWKTDASGNPDWRADAGGSFDTITTGTNTTATMTLGAGGTLTYTSTGVVNANQYRGTTLISASEFGYLDGVSSAIQAQFTGKQPLDSDLTALAAISGTRGDVLYYGASGWAALGVGTSGKYLKTQGAGADPIWDTPGGAGDITAVGDVTSGAAFTGTAGTWLKFNDTDGDGTLILANLTTARTWTLPNTTGTLITTGDTGTVTSTIIASDTIQEVDLEVTNSPTDNYLLSYDAGTAGFTWVVATTAMVYPGAGIALSTGSAWDTSITNNSSNWNTAYTDRMKWDGEATGLVADTGRTSLALNTSDTPQFARLGLGAAAHASAQLRINYDTDSYTYFHQQDNVLDIYMRGWIGGGGTEEIRIKVETDEEISITDDGIRLDETGARIDHFSTTLINEDTSVPTGAAIKLYGDANWGGGGWTDDGTTVRLTTATDYVGIGTTTPSDLLDVYSSTALSRIRIKSTNSDAALAIDSSASTEYAEIQLRHNGTTYWHFGSDAVNSNNFFLYSFQKTGGAAHVVAVDKEGNVGIGTTGPTEKLTIGGDSHQYINRDRTDGTLVLTGGTGATDGAFFQVYGNTYGLTPGSGKFVINDIDNTSNFAIQSYDSGAYTNRLYVNGQSGNVGIGTIAPGTKLEVVGVITATSGTSTNWNTAYTQTRQWDGGATGLVAATGRTSLELKTAALRAAEDIFTDGSNLPDGAAIKVYGDANWSDAGGDITAVTAGTGLTGGGVSGDVTLAVDGILEDLDALTVPTSNGQFIVATGYGAFAYESGATARTSLGLGSASIRNAEDTLTNGSNLPDGAAIKTYGDANWNKLVFDITDPEYGATPNDASDDTAAIQAAIDAALAAGGGTVWFPAGYYVVSDHDIIPDGNILEVITAGYTQISLIGEGGSGDYGTRLQITDSDDKKVIFIQSINGHIIRDLTIRWVNDGTQTDGAVGIYVTDDATHNSGMRIDNVKVQGGYYGIHFHKANSWILSNSVLRNSSYTGLLIENQYNSDSGDSCVSNNTLMVNPAGLAAVIYKSSGGCKFVNNKFIATGVDYLLYVEGTEHDGSTGLNSWLVTGNGFEGMAKHAIFMKPAASNPSNPVTINITGNELVGGIKIDATAANPSFNIVISGNLMGGAGTDATDAYIELDHCYNITITGNQFRKRTNKTYAIKTTNSTDIFVMANQYYGWAPGNELNGTGIVTEILNDLYITSGNLLVGENDLTPGALFLSGGGNGEEGGQVTFYRAADHDSPSDNFYIDIAATSLRFVDSNYGLAMDLTAQGDLSVTGDITANSCCGLDYVFESDYELRTLDNLREFIDEEGHLPDMTVNNPQNGRLIINKGIEELIVKAEEQALYILELHARLKVLEERLQ